jgi:hypothetical protein
MGKPGRPKKDNTKLTAYVSKDFQKSIRIEAITRDMTLGELIEEAFQLRRVTKVTTSGN